MISVQSYDCYYTLLEGGGALFLGHSVDSNMVVFQGMQ